MALTWHLMIGSVMLYLFRPLSFERPAIAVLSQNPNQTQRNFLGGLLQWRSQRLCLSFLLFRQSPLHCHFLLEASLFELRLSSESKQRQRMRNRAHRLNPKRKLHQLQPKPLKLFPRNRFTRVGFLVYVSYVESNKQEFDISFLSFLNSEEGSNRSCRQGEVPQQHQCRLGVFLCFEAYFFVTLF